MKILYQDKEWELNGLLTAHEAILQVGLEPIKVLIRRERDGKFLTRDVVLEPEDTIRLLPVVSGG
jgi:sulfur carrier protein ThiS